MDGGHRQSGEQRRVFPFSLKVSCDGNGKAQPIKLFHGNWWTSGKTTASGKTQMLDLVGPSALSGLVMSDSLRPHGLQPTRPLCLQNSRVKHAGVGCHFLLQGFSRPRYQTWVSCIGRQVLYRHLGSYFCVLHLEKGI